MAIKLHYSNLTTRGARNSILRYYDILTSELGLVMPHYLCLVCYYVTKLPIEDDAPLPVNLHRT